MHKPTAGIATKSDRRFHNFQLPAKRENLFITSRLAVCCKDVTFVTTTNKVHLRDRSKAISRKATRAAVTALNVVGEFFVAKAKSQHFTRFLQGTKE